VNEVYPRFKRRCAHPVGFDQCGPLGRVVAQQIGILVCNRSSDPLEVGQKRSGPQHRTRVSPISLKGFYRSAALRRWAGSDRGVLTGRPCRLCRLKCPFNRMPCPPAARCERTSRPSARNILKHRLCRETCWQTALQLAGVFPEQLQAAPP
jgi:hypothetical protein